mgnify:FL=1|tara:strand:+ start:1983 stop:3515 length:1533 start_codon:yes stop_codon:yes gene_type:complete
MNFKNSKSYIKKIKDSNVYDVADISPLEKAPILSNSLKNRVYLKREDLQPVYSFKLRGAYNKISRLKEKEISKGVIAASAGNHAQGVAYAAKKLRIKSIIVMPTTTPQIKINSVRRLGAKIALRGDSFDEAYSYAQKLARKEKLTFIHPYDDSLVIAGQGTIGKEILESADNIDSVFVPVGGGGLLAGIGAYIKESNPNIKVIGVEPEDAACLKAALEANRRVVLDEVGLFVDGVAVKQVGKIPFSIIREWVDDVVTVSVDEICASVKDIFEETRSLVEPAGALSLAGLKKYVHSRGLKNKDLIAINSGANINLDRLSHIVERVQLGEKSEVLFSVKIPEQRGSFRKFCLDLGKRMITEFNYRVDKADEAHIFVACKISKGIKEKTSLFKNLRKKGYSPIDLSENELAKIHIKHMVGGRAPKEKIKKGESIFRVEFPERPGALMDFLTTLGDRWNITLFHYRNQGSAQGRVLIGFQVSDEDKNNLTHYLQKTGFPFWDESSNKAYTTFLE